MGYDRIVGTLSNLGHSVSDQTMATYFDDTEYRPAPNRSQNTTWKDLIASPIAVLTGTDFFAVEVLTWQVWPLLRFDLHSSGFAPSQFGRFDVEGKPD